MKDIHAQAMGRKRWKGKTKEEKSLHGKKMVQAREAKRKAMKDMPVIEENGLTGL